MTRRLVLGECLELVIDRRGVTPSKLGSAWASSGHRVISAKHVKEGRIQLALGEDRFVDEGTYNRWMKTPLMPGDVLLTSEAPLGEAAYVSERLEWCLGQRLFGLRPRPDLLDGRYLAYLLTGGDAAAALHARASGTTVQGIRQAELIKIDILVPPLGQQKAAAALLGSLDDKIELNRTTGETLQAMARALFKSWFVDFDPVHAKAEGRAPAGMNADTAALFPNGWVASAFGDIPRGWSPATLGDIASVVDCLHSKKPQAQPEGRPFLQLDNILDSGMMELSRVYLVSEADYGVWTSKFEASPGDCVITNVGRVGAVAQVPAGLYAALGRNMTGVRARETFPFPTFILEALLSDAMREEIGRKTDTGTILDALNVRNIPLLRLVLPTREIASHFEKLARPLRAQMEANHRECLLLAELRDLLLPRLLSGELRVRDAEKVVGQVA